MKKSIIIGVCITTLLLLITPTISANQYNKVMEEQNIIIEKYEQSLQLKLENVINKLSKIHPNLVVKQNENEIQSNIIKNIQSIKEKQDKTLFLSNGLTANLILSFILSILGTIFGIIFGPILALITLILVSPAVLLAKFIEILVNIIGLIIP
jgi:uncharacterized ion transporter superfamily protein YfcC